MKSKLRKIPGVILEKVKTLSRNEIVVGCAVKFKASDLAAGALKHLGIEITPQGLQLPDSVLPLATRGKYSAWNVMGVEIIRKDLPIETHYHSAEAPNWGDSYYGTHTVDLPHKQYRRDFQPPREIEISMSCKDRQPGLPSYIIAFKVNEVLDKKAKQFGDRLFENLNLLQENVGACGVEPADTALTEYAKSLHVSWEILPPGTREEAIERIFRGRTVSDKEKEVAGERYDYFMSLMPKRLVFGTSGFRRYFGALLDDDLVIFENIQYGNAVYILFENWEDLSKRTRIELLSGRYGRDFKRVIHRSGWQGTVRAIVQAKREEKAEK